VKILGSNNFKKLSMSMNRRSLGKWMEETPKLASLFMKKWRMLINTLEETHNQDLELSSEEVSVKVCSWIVVSASFSLSSFVLWRAVAISCWVLMAGPSRWCKHC
jgi:hypothetical protein